MAPITFDGTSGKEHFSYRVKLREQVTAAAIAVPPVEVTEEVALP